MAGGKTRSNTLIGSDLHSSAKTNVCPGLLAQLVEQGTLNAWVGGSSPSQPTYVGKSDFHIQTLEDDVS